MEQPRMYTRQWLANHYGVSRKTLLKWIGHPLAYEIGLTRFEFNNNTEKGHIFQARLFTPKQLKEITKAFLIFIFVVTRHTPCSRRQHNMVLFQSARP